MADIEDDPLWRDQPPRGSAVAAVLGPTYLANTFQAINQFPNLMYAALTGSVFTMLIVPALVHHLDAGDSESEERVAGGFLGIVLVAFAVLVLIAVVASPLLLRVFAAGATSPDIAAAE